MWIVYSNGVDALHFDYVKVCSPPRILLRVFILLVSRAHIHTYIYVRVYMYSKTIKRNAIAIENIFSPLIQERAKDKNNTNRYLFRYIFGST